MMTSHRAPARKVPADTGVEELLPQRRDIAASVGRETLPDHVLIRMPHRRLPSPMTPAVTLIVRAAPRPVKGQRPRRTSAAAAVPDASPGKNQGRARVHPDRPGSRAAAIWN